MTGALVGSPSYIAPERALGRQAGPPADLWGLGASLYAAVEGHGPFDRDGGALVSLTAAVADEPAPAIHAGPLWPVINGLLRKDPGRRLDAAEAEWMLRQVAASAAPARPGAPAAPARRDGPRHRRRRIPAVVLAASAALAVLAASAAAADLALTRSPRQAPPPAATRAVPAQAGPRAPAGGPRSPAAWPWGQPAAGTRLTARLSREPSAQAAPAGAGSVPGHGRGRHARPPGQARGGKHGHGNGRHQG